MDNNLPQIYYPGKNEALRRYKGGDKMEVCPSEYEGAQEYRKEINILLLGETGVGKSTFINAFANYLTYSNLCEAENENLISVIPSKFTVTDENYEERTIEIGQSENESQEIGASATQNAKSYVFPLGDVRIRLIDTPGIGDTRGAEQDNINFEKLLVYLGEFKELHAICILLKPNNSRITVMFEYCIKQLLSRLEKSASQNIVFLFTNSRSTFYRPGDTLPPLRKILEGTQNKPPYVKIPLDKKNIYCIDNEAFRFLIALTHGIKFSDREKEDFATSWKTSSEECMRLLNYIAELKPHKVQDTLSINEARRLIVQLSQPLAEIANLIQINIVQLQRQQDLLDLFADDMENLKKNLYVPVTNIRAEELVEVDENINSQILTKENTKKAAEQLLKDIEQRRLGYEQEQDKIIKSTAKFAHFLQNNAIRAYNDDAYQSYLEYLIDREKSLGCASDKKNIENFQNRLRQYNEEKKALDTALELAKQGNISATSCITAKDVMMAIKELHSLPQCGPKIKELFEKQNRAKSHENYIEREVNFNHHNKKNMTRIKEMGKNLTSRFKKWF